MKNPLSKTRFEFTKDRIQHHSLNPRICRECGEIYYPKVHSQPYIVQFGAILIGLACYLIFRFNAPVWLYAGLPIAIIIWMLIYYYKDRKAVSPKMVQPKYGQLIIECPKCDGDRP